MRKKFLFLFLIFLLIFPCFSYANNTKLNLNCRACVVFDRNSKQQLYKKNSNNKIKMASTTKIMTAILVIENFNLDETVNVSKKSASTGGSRLGLKIGDKITIRDLLYGLMLCSGNDAAICLSESCYGNVSNFVDKMNEKSTTLGLVSTHFESPHGLDSDEHYTTAYELALLTDYALRNDIFCTIVNTKYITISINGIPHSIHNTNELLGNLNGVYGVKTGFTNGANRCLVTACKRGEMDIICVVLGCDTKNFRTKDSINLIEFCFNNFQYVNIKEKFNNFLIKYQEENIKNFAINKGISYNLNYSLEELNNNIISINKTDIDNLNINIFLNYELKAPIVKGQKIGEIILSINDEVLSKCDIITTNEIKKKNISNYLIEFYRKKKLLNFTF